MTTRKGLISPTSSVSQPSNGRGSMVIPWARSWMLRTNRYFLSVTRFSASRPTGVESTRGTADITSSRSSFPSIRGATSVPLGPTDSRGAVCVDIQLSLFRLARHLPFIRSGWTNGWALPVSGESRCDPNGSSVALQILDKIHLRMHVAVEDHRIEDLVHRQPVQRIIVRRAELQG